MAKNLRCQLRSVARGVAVRWSSTESQTEIVIPKRIPRSPTDILRALASTVKQDYTAAHYKYHDDPYLIPTSNTAKRAYAMAQEAGRKAAYWIRQEHAELFQHRVADPPVQAFFPRAVYDENSEVNESVLLTAISDWCVQDAINIHTLLEKKGIEISRDTKQRFLEMLCFYNSEDAFQEEWIEERWFRQSQKGMEKHSKTWKDNGIAEQIFNSLSPADSASYSAIIAGMALHGQFEKACRKYKEAKEAQIAISIDAYNCLIVGSPFLKESYEMRWAFVEDMMKAINEEGIMPNLGTLNAVLESLSSMPSFRHAKTNALRVIAEFKTLGIEPSLASYFHILNIFCTERGGVSSVLVDIVNVLEKQKSLTIQDPKDIWFFMKAMDVCRFHLVDKDLAYRVDSLLHTGDNYNFIGDSYKESVYYRHFFMLLCQTEQLDTFMTLYNRLVPHIYVPEPVVMEEVLKTVDINGAAQYLPQLWSDIIRFDYSSRENLITALLTGLKNSSTEDEKLRTDLADIATAVFEKFRSQDEQRENKRISWTASMFGDIMEVVLRGDKFDVACEILNILDTKQHQILGAPNIDSLSAFLDACISKNDVTNAIKCIQYCCDAGFPDAGPFSQKLNNSLKLSEYEKNKLATLVGKDFLELSKDAPSSN